MVPAIALAEAGDEFRLRVDAEMREDFLHITVDGLLAEAEVGGDGVAGLAADKQIDDEPAAGREPGDRAGAGARGPIP